MTIFLIIVIIFLLFVMLGIKSKSDKKNQELSRKYDDIIAVKKNLDSENQRLSKENYSLYSKLKPLEKYSGLLDVQRKADEILKEANCHKQKVLDEEIKLRKEATEIISNAKDEANVILKQAREKLDNSISESSQIVIQAELRATEIAGSAYEAKRNAELYENTVIAMKNTIKGYGDEYLKPTFSLLDDLAEEFSHTDAGQKLKLARERNVILVKTEKAAKCDYVEASRRKTAIEFVLDAFNGKIDSILSKVKKDNFGILERKIIDSFSLVNHNGRAFRNAEITTEYLNSRLDELKWAVITQELKWQEKEEQRLIREQIREEEKARKEYEKAILEAEKEELLLKKLIEKAQKEIELASDQEKKKYQEKLNELEMKLKVAEDKNQRAISMAQQTKAGNVYIISNIGSFGENVYKIGMTRRLEPLDRVRELGDASVPFEFDVHALIYSENAPLLERNLHKRFLKLQLNKVNPRKEFFNVEISDIKNACTELGIVAKWTLTAEAKQYRESQAIAEAIKNNKQLEEEWESFQEEAELETQYSEQESID